MEQEAKGAQRKTSATDISNVFSGFPSLSTFSSSFLITRHNPSPSISKFCLCPLGWAPWSPRLVESVALGCVPVIIADGIRLPFPAAVPWSEISLTVAESSVDTVGEVLERVAATNLTAIQRNLWEPVVRRALLFNIPIVEGDATWQVLESPSMRMGRSNRKSSASTK